MKKQNGITLIALVATIVLLLVIAGVSLITLFGEDGVITKSRQADLKNDHGIVADALKVEILQFNTIKVADNLSKMPIEYLEEKNYIDEDYIVQVKNLTSTDLKTGNGSLEKGDIYQIQGEQLVYIDTEGITTTLASLGAIGELPIRMYFKSDISATNFMLGLDQRTESFHIDVTNKDDKITKHDIQYQILIGPEDENQDMIFDVEINGVTSADNIVSGTLNGREEKVDQYNFKLKVKEGKKANDSNRLRVVVKTIAPLEREETFSLEVKNDNLIDYSSNGYHAKLKGGTKIIKDEQGRYALSFDGIDDYIQLPTLPGSFNWKKGVVIETEVLYEATNQNSMLVMIGNGTVSQGAGKDHIILQNMGTSGRLGFHVQGKAKEYVAETKDSVITLNQKMNIKVAMKDIASAYYSDTYINGTEVATSEVYVSSVINPIQNVDRTENYLGKSSWTADEYFKGRIYSIKLSLTDGTVIFDYDLNR